MRSILLTVALTLLLMPAVFAGQITGGTVGLISPGHVITFEELALTENEAVTTQFALYGATFTGVGADVNNAYGGGGSTGFSGSTYLFSGFSGFSLPVVIGFDSPVNAAAIAAVDQGDTFDVVAYLGGTSGTLVDSLSITIPANPPGVGFVGFTGETFDTLVFTGTGALGLDTLEFNSAVPEPANVFFIGLGLAFMAARRKLIR